MSTLVTPNLGPFSTVLTGRRVQRTEVQVTVVLLSWIDTPTTLLTLLN